MTKNSSNVNQTPDTCRLTLASELGFVALVADFLDAGFGFWAVAAAAFAEGFIGREAAVFAAVFQEN